MSAAIKPKPEDAAGVGSLATQFYDLRGVIFETLPGRATPREQAALDYWASAFTLHLAESWRDRAKKLAIALGVLPNYQAEPFAVGTAETVYSDARLSIAMRVTPQADRFDAAAFIAELTALGVLKPAVLKRMVKRHTRSFAGAHVFQATLAA